MIHGDDFTVLGDRLQLDWFRAQIAMRYEVKMRGRLGPSGDDKKSIRILNRVVQWTPEGIRYEADQRHAEIIVQQLGMEKANPVSTPGIKPSEEVRTDGDEEPLEPRDATRYRAITARGLYIAQDRTDIQYAVKELSRWMSKPTLRDWRMLKRLGRYLVDKTREVMLYGYQEKRSYIDAWVDTDFAGCRRTRKSTSGGVILFGSHLLKSWSTTQAILALSSGEAEYYGMVRGGSMPLGTRAFWQTWRYR